MHLVEIPNRGISKIQEYLDFVFENIPEGDLTETKKKDCFVLTNRSFRFLFYAK